MAQSDGQEQPSMEEILASIRRIISDDEALESDRPAVSAADEQPEEEVLELTDRVERPEVEHGEVKQGRAEADEQPAPKPQAAKFAPGARPAARKASGAQTGESLLSGSAAAAAVAALSQAGRPLSGSADAASPGGEGQTLDALVRQALTPLLKAWLDENLPPLVERIVREEVRRLAQQARDG